MRTTFRLFLAGAAVLSAACQDAAQTAGPGGEESFQSTDAPAGSLVAGQYIVVFRDDVADPPGLARRLVQSHGGSLRYTYQHALRGFAAALPEQAVEALRRNPNVAYIEQDQVVRAITTQTGATWGLDRVDQRDRPLSGSYTYPDAGGAGVNAYILDTGIRLSHADFGGRASSGYDAVDGGSADDCNGHGTHVAGTVGGSTWGVAKAVSLHAVRVLDCSGNGTTSGVIAGIDWVTANHVDPAVANMSLGGGASSTLDAAVSKSINAGVTYALAAGNGDFLGRPQDACNSSPARVGAGLTVGSTTSSDTESSFSNYGTCVDILAPGSSIKSAWYQSDTQTNTISGTSMATPHVAGAAALYLAANPGATPSQVASALVSNASQNKITLHSRSSSGGTPNRLLYMGFIGGGTTEPPPPPPPSDGISLAARGYKVKGSQRVDLTWSGAASTSVDVFRDGSRITTTANDGADTDNLNTKGGGSYTYRVCEAGTSTCSANVTVTF